MLRQNTCRVDCSENKEAAAEAGGLAIQTHRGLHVQGSIHRPPCNALKQWGGVSQSKKKKKTEKQNEGWRLKQLQKKRGGDVSDARMEGGKGDD